MQRNPYTPEAGFVPTFLAGREDLHENAQSYLEGIKHRYPQQSIKRIKPELPIE